jgi:hypothetical protein
VKGAARARLGAAIVLVNSGSQAGEIRHIRVGIAGKDIKPDTWYSLDDNGDFVEA